MKELNIKLWKNSRYFWCITGSGVTSADKCPIESFKMWITTVKLNKDVKQ